MTPEELRIIQEGGPERAARFTLEKLFNANLLWVCLMYFCFGYCLYFYLTWLPTYLKDARGFSSTRMNAVHTVVLLSAAVQAFWAGILRII